MAIAAALLKGHLYHETRTRNCRTHTTLAGRPDRALADRSAETLREKSAASQRGRPRQDRRLDPQVGLDNAGAGRRARRTDLRGCAPRRRESIRAELRSSDRREALERGREARLPDRRSSIGGAGKFGPRLAARRAAGAQ